MKDTPFQIKKLHTFLMVVLLNTKTKNFHNLCLHKTDFGIKAEWQFFTTSHGKSACDGLSGTVKWLASKASPQRLYNNQILTQLQLYEFAAENISGIDFVYSSTKEYEGIEKNCIPPQWMNSNCWHPKVSFLPQKVSVSFYFYLRKSDEC